MSAILTNGATMNDEYDDPQLWTVKEFLESELEGITDYIEELSQDPDDGNIDELVMLKHVVDYLNLRLAGHYT